MRVCALCPGPVETLFGGRSGNEGTILFKWTPVAVASDVARFGWEGMLRGHRSMVYGLVPRLLMLGSFVLPMRVVLLFSDIMLREV